MKREFSFGSAATTYWPLFFIEKAAPQFIDTPFWVDGLAKRLTKPRRRFMKQQSYLKRQDN